MSMKMSLNPFKKGKKTDIEKQIEVEVIPDIALEKIVNYYLSIPNGKDPEYYKEQLKRLNDFKLNPVKVNAFLQYVIHNNILKVGESKGSLFTGHYISSLIMSSYHQGYNEFVLNTNDVLIDKLCSSLKAKSSNPINIHVNGDVGSWFGASSQHINYFIDGGTDDYLGQEAINTDFYVTRGVGDHCASLTSKCNLHVKEDSGIYLGTGSDSLFAYLEGDVGDHLGNRAEESWFIVKGSVLENLGNYAKDSYFFVKGDVGDDCSHNTMNCYFSLKGNVGDNVGLKSEKCLFKIQGNIGEKPSGLFSKYRTHNKDTYQKLLKCVANTNKIQLTNENGSIIKEVFKE